MDIYYRGLPLHGWSRSIFSSSLGLMVSESGHPFTALSGEKVKGYAYEHVDYPPYELGYFNEDPPNNNFIFFKEPGSYVMEFREIMPGIEERLDLDLEYAKNLIAHIEHFDLEADIVPVGNGWLIYNISPHIFPHIFGTPPPEVFPSIELSRTEFSGEDLQLYFKNKTIDSTNGFRLHVEIPGYSSRTHGISLENETLDIKIPAPHNTPFALRYGVDYSGILIPATVREISLPGKPVDSLEKSSGLVYLSGSGPFIELEERTVRICEKHFTFKLATENQGKTPIRIYLFSPFQFPQSIWYGSYAQSVKIKLNGQDIGEKTLQYGENRISIEASNSYLKKGENVVSLDFKYQKPFSFAPLWETATLLERIEFE
jgi:hypothetical protein